MTQSFRQTHEKAPARSHADFDWFVERRGSSLSVDVARRGGFLYADLEQVEEKEKAIGKKTREKASHTQGTFIYIYALWRARRSTAVSCKPGGTCSFIAVGDLCLVKSKSVLPVWHCMK